MKKEVFVSVLLIIVSALSLCQSARIAKLESANELLHRRVVRLQDKYGEQGE